MTQLAFATIAFSALFAAGEAHDAGPHSDDPLKRSEHMAVMDLVDPDTAVEATGSSRDLQTAPDSDLYVPEDEEFLIDGDLDVRRILIEGTLRVTESACTIRFETIIGGTCGQLIVPASPNLRRFIVKARGPRDRDGDPTDVAGGIILHSPENTVEGQAKTRIAVPSEIGPNYLRFATPVENWQPGDRILIPGITWDSPDDVVSIVSIDDGGLRVVTEAIGQDHRLPDKSLPAVGNLTCSVVIESENPDQTQRGHLMVMHEHTGTAFRHVRFSQLGRTSVESTPTTITLGPEGEFVAGDENTIGRYPLHFHGRNGADKTVDPHYVEGCVIEDSPTHGLVNHGSHVSAVGNVVYDCAGSNLFAENGIEIGDFTDNLCVLSRGRQSKANRKDEFHKKNFGWEGTLVWLNGPGIDVEGNHLYRAKRALIEMDCEILPDAGTPFSYPVAYVREGAHKQMLLSQPKPPQAVGVFQVPARFVGNTGAGAVFGMHLQRHLYDLKSFDTRIYPEKTPVHDTRMFNVDSGINGTYLGHLDIRHCRFDGNLKLSTDYRPYTGTPSGTKVHDLVIADCEIRRFQSGVVDRGWSDLTVENCLFENNLIDIQLLARSSIKSPHTVTLARSRHGGRRQMQALYAKRNPKTVYGAPADYWVYGTYPERSGKYEIEQFLVAPHTLDGHMLFYSHNAASFVPFEGTGTEYDGKTNQQLMDEHGVCVDGRFFAAGDEIEQLPRTNVPIWIAKFAETAGNPRTPE